MTAIVKDTGSKVTDQELHDMRHRDRHAVLNTRVDRGATRHFTPDKDAGDSVEQCVIDRARLLRLVKELTCSS